MPITPFLRNHVFTPEEIDMMGAAFQAACIMLGLVDRTDPVTEVVAGRIIDHAQRGVLTKTELYEAAIKGFKPYSR